MLLKLSITNFAIIRHTVFEPVQGLNIITGETGAGKSIILDALNLILGSRADIKTQSEWGEKCIVEGEFALNHTQYGAIFSELDIDFEPVTIIRREILTSGKTRTFINDTPVSLQQLRSLTATLVSIHSQHENAHLTDKAFQFSLLDAFAGQSEAIQDYRSQYRRYRADEQTLNELKLKQAGLLKEKDYLAFLLSEFETAALRANEEEALETELNMLGNAEQVTQVTEQLLNTLTESEQSVIDTLSQLRNRFKAIETVHPLSKEIADRLQSAVIELKDIASEAAGLGDLIQADPARLEQLNERLSLIQNLKRKHAAADYADLFRINEALADQLFSIGNIDQQIEQMQLQNAKLLQSLHKAAAALHKQREKAAAGLKPALEQNLKLLEMPNARIEFELQTTTELNEFGSSDLQIKFTANLGMPLQALNKVASGGELSRLALCIRSIEASQKQLNSLVFDEIDTGVSGKVADTIGNMFRQIAASHQVIAITHLPQVAGYGDAHFMVCKREEDNTTVSFLKRLDAKERVDELAKMLSGNEATDIARKNAKELLKV